MVARALVGAARQCLAFGSACCATSCWIGWGILGYVPEELEGVRVRAHVDFPSFELYINTCHCSLHRFYKKLGFHELGRADDDLWLGMRLVDAVPRAMPPFCAGVIEGTSRFQDCCQPIRPLMVQYHCWL
jgi:hypothetical protein